MTESDQKNLQDPYLFDDEIDLRELFNVMWEGKKLIILITSVVIKKNAQVNNKVSKGR